MLSAQLTPASFAQYPPAARGLAIAHLAQLQHAPLAFLPLLLRELIAFDWKFPVEQRELRNQLQYLAALSPARFADELQPFARLRLSPELEAVDWVNFPAQFSEQLSAHLWATHQIEAFRQASVEYVRKLDSANPPSPPALPRLTLALFGQGVTDTHYRLFRKLHPQGTYFTNVENQDSHVLFLALVGKRAAQADEPFNHWYVDGGSIATPAPPAVAQISYRALDPVRTRLVNKMRQTMQPGGGGPEALRTMMAQMSPEEIGLTASGPQPANATHNVMNRFQVSLLTEGSGTQLFSTTFVQWTAREVLRRAQPLTLYTCYAPRQREQSMREMLSGATTAPQPDPHGSLIDADMGIYYTWINAQRLPGAERSSLVACFEGHRQVMAVGPAFTSGKTDGAPTSLSQILARLA